MIEMPTDKNPVVIIHGDCNEILPQIPEGAVDAVVTDPPYGIGYQSARRTDTERFNILDGDDKPQTEWPNKAYRTLASGGCVLCFCEWSHAEQYKTAINNSGLKVAAQLVWDRIIHGLGDPSSRPAPQHDLIWFAVKGRYLLPNGRPSSVYRFQRLSGHELRHPTQKPVPLMAKLINDYVPINGLILDPFAGSGTTGVAAVLEGRKCILIEKDARYVEVIRKRIKHALCESPTQLPFKHPTLLEV